MKIKTSELTGMALDWAVAEAEGIALEYGLTDDEAYSTNWALGGPIIEREHVWLRGPYPATKPDGTIVLYIHFWYAHINYQHVQSGPTPLIAAMRCYVASKLGAEIDVPENLM